MPEVFHGSSKLDTVFDLLGRDEPDLTDALGWGLGQSPALLNRLLARCFPDEKPECEPAEVAVYLQHHTRDGRTDVEIVERGRYHVIVEAKKGWVVPTSRQLHKYERELTSRPAQRQCLALLTDATEEYAHAQGFDPTGYKVELAHITWAQLLGDLKRLKVSKRAESQLLGELRHYLGAVVHDRRVDSNLVYVVSLTHETPDWMTISFVDVVAQQRRYFHAYGPGWPKEAPNYFGFRYDGRLQSIHHVEAREIRDGLVGALNGIRANAGGNTGPHAVYTLGSPIVPAHEVRSGPIRNRRVWAMIDTLLTAKNIPEAEAITKARLKAADLAD